MDINLIENIYYDSSASVITRYGLSPEFSINRGVKQGDPLSPIIFSLVLNPLLIYLQHLNKGYTLTSRKHISNLTFADDVNLLSETKKNTKALFKAVLSFCRCHNMKINFNKCVYVTTEPNPSSFQISFNETKVTIPLTPSNTPIRITWSIFNFRQF
jgi:retron-type reverse transcriptase